MSTKVLYASVVFSSVQSVVSNSLRPHGLQRARPPCPSPTPGVYSNSCHESVMPSSHLILSLPFPPAFNLSQHQGLFKWVSFHIRWPKYWSFSFSIRASVLPVNIQAWFPLGWTGWISLQSKGLSRVFSNPTVQKHQFFGTQLTWLLEKPWLWLDGPLLQSNVSAFWYDV